MNTRSVKSSHVPGLSVNFAGSDGLSPSIAELDVLRADGAEIQIDGSRARTAIQREGDRPVLALHGVRGKDHLADLLAVVDDRQRAHGDRVVERFAIELNALRHMRVGGQRSLFVGGFFPYPYLYPWHQQQPGEARASLPGPDAGKSQKPA